MLRERRHPKRQLRNRADQSGQCHGSWRARNRLALALCTVAGVVAASLIPGVCHAEPPRFSIEVEQNQVTVGESFLVQVNLSISNDEISDYRPPDFRGLRVLQASRAPNQSTQMQFGAAGMIVEATYSWRYEVAAVRAGAVSIGPARMKVNGQELRSSVATISVLAASVAATPNASATPSPLPSTVPDITAGTTPPSADVDPAIAAAAAAAAATAGTPPEAARGESFIRVVTDKSKAFVGEAIGATWFLYMNQPHDKYDTVVEPRMESFWIEDVSTPSRRGSLVLTQELVAGRPYQVGAILKKAMFPLKDGRLTITPMEADLSRVSLFGSSTAQHVRSVATAIEVLPLPIAGRPPGFDVSNVGRFTLTTRVDRNDVSVGDPVTLTIDISGRGNLRKVGLPTLPKLVGWKVYEPRINVIIDPNTGVTGTKSAEILLLPSRAGSVSVPGLVLSFFDPETAKYSRAEAPGFTLRAGDAATTPPPVGSGSVPAAGRSATGANDGDATASENVIADDIRPIRTRTLKRDVGTTFMRTTGFRVFLVSPPVLLMVALVGLRVRRRLYADTEGRRQKQNRQRVQAHLAAADRHRRHRQPGPFFLEIERAIQSSLEARLGRPVKGMRTDELRAALDGTPEFAPRDIDLIFETLAGCERARFAPGTISDPEGTMTTTLQRAGALVALVGHDPPRRKSVARQGAWL